MGNATRLCPKCGSENAVDGVTRYCPQCGAYLGTTEQGASKDAAPMGQGTAAGVPVAATQPMIAADAAGQAKGPAPASTAAPANAPAPTAAPAPAPASAPAPVPTKTCRHCNQSVVGNPKKCPHCGKSLARIWPFILLAAAVVVAAVAAAMLFIAPKPAPSVACTVAYYDVDTSSEIQASKQYPGTVGATVEVEIPEISGYRFDYGEADGCACVWGENAVSVTLPESAGQDPTIALYYVPMEGDEPGDPDEGGSFIPNRALLEDYSWEELEDISEEIAAAANEDDALEIAQKYNLVGDDGRLTGDEVKTVELANGVKAQVQIIGFAHDTLADGSTAGISFAFRDCVADHIMNTAATNAGGWEDSDLREWMNKTLFDSLPGDLQQAIEPAAKLTNNVGKSESVGCVTTTSDKLWLLSARELFGDIDWYGANLPYNDIFNAEGEQYQLFREAGLVSDSSNLLLVKNFLPASSSAEGFAKDEPCYWWLRTPGMNYGDTFRRVDTFGHPLYNDPANIPSGVAPCFCI